MWNAKWLFSYLASDLKMLEAGCQRLVEGQVLWMDIDIKVAGDGEHLVHNVVLLLQGRQLCRHASQEGQVVDKLLHCVGKLVQALRGSLKTKSTAVALFHIYGPEVELT